MLCPGDYIIEATTYYPNVLGSFSISVLIETNDIAPPSNMLETFACEEGDLSHSSRYVFEDSEGPEFYEVTAPDGIEGRYITRWMDEAAGILLECSAVRYDDIRNAQWDGLNYSSILRSIAQDVDLQSHRINFTPLLGDDSISYILSYKDGEEERSLTTVRFLDASSSTLTTVTTYEPTDNPESGEAWNVAMNIADRLFQSIPTPTTEDEMSGRFEGQ